MKELQAKAKVTQDVYKRQSEDLMEFFNSAVDTLQTIVVGLGGALCVWGGINLLAGYGQDNPCLLYTSRCV